MEKHQETIADWVGGGVGRVRSESWSINSLLRFAGLVNERNITSLSDLSVLPTILT